MNASGVLQVPAVGGEIHVQLEYARTHEYFPRDVSGAPKARHLMCRTKPSMVDRKKNVQSNLGINFYFARTSPGREPSGAFGYFKVRVLALHALLSVPT